MTAYNLYCTIAPPPDRLAAALGEVAGVPASSVDLAHPDTAARDWQVAVLGTLSPMGGHLRLAVEVWLGETAVRRPPEPEAAAILARSLGTPVCYPAVEPRPSAYWFALPDGVHTRVRWVDPDEMPADGEPCVVRFSASERPIAALPDVPVRPIPEVIHDHRLPEGLGIPALALWEHLIIRIESGWPPDGWYPAEFYHQWLSHRDAIDPAALDEPTRAALAALDTRFRHLTRDDAGAALLHRLSDAPLDEPIWSTPPAIGTGWWWRRITDPPPWAAQP
ncbi:hypothetical protein [Catenuloplanes japonicus]|uniref:hypothetical protein n=1 Tax=Catenuloplanes japonicus TaxID=33876 RepID=UPI00068DE3C5|nr:hypothetical protein [Catenuloplanes japonicus]